MASSLGDISLPIEYLSSSVPFHLALHHVDHDVVTQRYEAPTPPPITATRCKCIKSLEDVDIRLDKFCQQQAVDLVGIGSSSTSSMPQPSSWIAIRLSDSLQDEPQIDCARAPGGNAVVMMWASAAGWSRQAPSKPR